MMGKKTVAVLTSKEVKKAIDMMNKFRDVGIHPDNLFVFARTQRNSHRSLRGWDSLKAVAQRARLEQPQLINSMKL